MAGAPNPVVPRPFELDVETKWFNNQAAARHVNAGPPRFILVALLQK